MDDAARLLEEALTLSQRARSHARPPSAVRRCRCSLTPAPSSFAEVRTYVKLGGHHRHRRRRSERDLGDISRDVADIKTAAWKSVEILTKQTEVLGGLQRTRQRLGAVTDRLSDHRRHDSGAHVQLRTPG